MQGYDVDIRHIPLKKNPANSLSCQLIADVLGKKGSVKDANAEYVQKLWVNSVATDEEIQKALYKLFDSSPQGKHRQGPQGQSILSNQSLKAQLFQRMKIQALKAQKQDQK